MKITKGVDKKVGKKTYYKYRINLPKKEIEESGLLDKDLIIKITKNKIIIQKKL